MSNFGILRISGDALHMAAEDMQIPEGTDVDWFRQVLMLPETFKTAHGPFWESARDLVTWVIVSDEIPATDEDRLVEIVPVYSRHHPEDGAPYTTLDRVEMRSGKDYRLLTALACAIPLPA